jgi:hypothetical protein
MRRYKLLSLLASCLIAVLICGAGSANPTRDYNFSVTGIVASEDGTVIPNATVVLELDGPVYEGVDLIKRAERQTDATGGFVFAYISHKKGVEYTISIRAEGFEPATVRGSAPPPGHHTIHLTKAAEKRPAS